MSECLNKIQCTFTCKLVCLCKYVGVHKGKICPHKAPLECKEPTHADTTHLLLLSNLVSEDLGVCDDGDGSLIFKDVAL